MRISDWSSDVCSSDRPRIFLAAAEHLGVAPPQILHVGDDPVMDMAGARDAGLRTAWINRDGLPWPSDDRKSDVSGKSVSVRVDLGGRRHIKTKKQPPNPNPTNITRITSTSKTN